MSLKNFRAKDFKKKEDKEDNVKVENSNRDRNVSSPEPQARVEENPEPTSNAVVSSNEVPSGTVPEILGWVGDDIERAGRALESELNDNKPRKGLVNSLNALVNPPEESEESPEEEEEPEEKE